MKKFLLFFGFVCFFSPSGTAQNPADELRKVLSFYQGDFTISYKMKIKYENNDGTPRDSLDAFVVVHGDECYYKIGDVEVVYTGGKMITVDNSQKLIMMNKSQKIPLQINTLNVFDSLSKAGLIEYDLKKQDKNRNKLVLRMKKNPTTVAEIIYETETHRPVEVKSDYNEEYDFEKQKMITGILRVYYSEFKKSQTPFPYEQYSVNKYITSTGKNFKPTDTYKKYDLKLF